MSVLSLAADTRKADFNALSAEEAVRYMRQVKQTADASAELARRMEHFGKVFFADASLNLARAQQAQRATRERLTRL